MEVEAKMRQNELDKMESRAPIESSFSFIPDSSVPTNLRRVPDLSQEWCVAIHWVPFLPSDNPDMSSQMALGGDMSRVDVLQQTDDDLLQLLRMPFHRFWSQLMFDPSLNQFLDSVLRYARRRHERRAAVQDTNPREVQLFRSIMRRVFVVYIRMARLEEGTASIGLDTWAAAVYDKWLFDVCKLADIACIYGPTNRAAVSSMLEKIFTWQPRYGDDFKEFISQSITLLQQLETQSAKLSTANISSSSTVSDLISYLDDLSRTVSAVTALFPPAALEQISLTSLTVAVCVTYEQTLARCKSCSAVDKRPLNNIRSQLISIVANLFTRLLFEPTLNQPNIQGKLREKRRQYAEEVYRLLTQLTGEPDSTAGRDVTVAINGSFYRRLNRAHDIESSTLNWFTHPSVAMDETRIKYLQAILHQVDPPIQRKPKPVKSKIQPSTSAASHDPQTVAITAVREMFPDYGAGFISRCLQFFDSNVSQVIDSLLENNLPPHLDQLDRSLALESVAVEKEPLTADETDFSLLAARRNIYDGDEFDLNRPQQFAVNQVHIGKRQISEDADNEFRKLMKERIATYDAYDDEYDDTYDGYAGYDLEAEATPADPLLQPNPNRPVGKALESSEDEDDSSDDATRQTTNANGTARPVSVTGQDRGGKQNAPSANGRKKNGRGRGGGAKPQQDDSTRNVVQGQTHQAKRKEQNKARVANHNRKNAASRKMNRGMTPI
eukprot:GILK01007193.1.p1 GENE.GILK01007193.1~~GILK01007193.1.p1  ORF type:complete len:771 (-),score=185.49 GILK01007193.1:63-2228(-)